MILSSLSSLAKEKVLLMIFLICALLVSHNYLYQWAYIITIMMVFSSFFIQLKINTKWIKKVFEPFTLCSLILFIPVVVIGHGVEIFNALWIGQCYLLIVCFLNYMVVDKRNNVSLYEDYIFFCIIAGVFLTDNSFNITYLLFSSLLLTAIFIYKKNSVVKSVAIMVFVFIFCVITNNVLNTNISIMSFNKWDEVYFDKKTQIGKKGESSKFENNNKVNLENRILFYATGKAPESMKLKRQILQTMYYDNGKVLWSEESSKNSTMILLEETERRRQENENKGSEKFLIPSYSYIDDSINYAYKRNTVETKILGQLREIAYFYFNKKYLLNSRILINNRPEYIYPFDFLSDKKRFIFDRFFLKRSKKVNFLDISFYSRNNDFSPANTYKREVIEGNGFHLNYKDSFLRTEKKKLTVRYFYNDSEYISKDSPVVETQAPVDAKKNPELSQALKEVIKEAGIKESDSINEKILKLRDFFVLNYKYTLDLQYNNHPRTLEDFLLKDRRGHCEFFATVTVLLLREMNIPAQYQTGIVLERTGKDTYVGKSANAHAWAIYWDGEGWKDIDTTVSNQELDGVLNKAMNSLTLDSIININNDLFSKFSLFSLDMKNSQVKSLLDNLESLYSGVQKKIIFALILFFIIGIVFFKYIKRNKKYQIRRLEKKLRKDLKIYLKKAPKPDYIPWRIWAEETKEIVCIEKVKEFYNNVYVVEKK